MLNWTLKCCLWLWGPDHTCPDVSLGFWLCSFSGQANRRNRLACWYMPGTQKQTMSWPSSLGCGLWCAKELSLGTRWVDLRRTWESQATVPNTWKGSFFCGEESYDLIKLRAHFALISVACNSNQATPVCVFQSWYTKAPTWDSCLFHRLILARKSN
jgi:hypothetical protein